MRLLFSSTGGEGHLGPLLPLIAGALARADDVVVLVPANLAGRVEALGARVLVMPEPPAAEVAGVWTQVAGATSAEASRLVNRELFGRLNTAARLALSETTMRSWRPHAVLHEAAEFSATIAAQRARVPNFTVAIGLAEVEARSLDIAEPALTPYGPDVVDWLRAAPYLTRLPAVLDPSPYPDTWRFREADVPVDTAAAPDGELPLVYVSFGTVVAGLPGAGAGYEAVLGALADLPVRVLLTLGGGGQGGTGQGGTGQGVPGAAEIPANARVETWVQQDEVLARSALVVCHGGAGTTFGALRAGRPLVLIPFMADQPSNARMVRDAGAGLIVAPGRGPNGAIAFTKRDSARIRTAVVEVLGDDSYRQRAAGIGAEMRGAASVSEVLLAIGNRCQGGFHPTQPEPGS